MIFNWVADTLGIGIRHLMSYFLYITQMTLTMLLFARAYRRKRLYPLRLAGMLAGGLALSLLIAKWRTAIPDEITAGLILFRIFSYFVLSAYVYGMLLVCCAETPFTLAICWAAVTAAAGVFTNFNYVLVFAAGNDPMQSMSFLPTGNWLTDLLLYYGLLVVFLLIVSHLFVKQAPRFAENTRDNAVALLLCIGVVLVDDVMMNVSRPFEPESAMLALCFRIAILVCFLFALGLLLGLIKWNRLGTELTVTEQLLLREKRYYRQSKANVESVNRMLHDLKHRLNDIGDKLTTEELNDLRRAMALYDANIKTGNEVLDTILYEKQLYCQQNGVRLTCMADGALLKSVSPSLLYSLFDNAIDNAMEAVLRLDDPESRLVALTVSREGEAAEIVVRNLYDPASDAAVTAKADKNRHGYGIASMKTAAERCGGTLMIDRADGIFTLTVRIPAA
ncbi:MAG: sensor histidine kinase [Clostridia bacterium]|nr:sensor histidine kinase [Clostridia bacterium]